jgi:hypothetical protein
VSREHLRRAAPSFLLVLLLVLLLDGCFAPERRILATVRDPDAVSLHALDANGTSKEILPADGQPASAVVASGTFGTGGTSSAAYELAADRLPDHSLRLRWVHPPIVGGEIDTMVPPGGRIVLEGTDDVRATLRLDGPVLRIPYSAYLTPTYAHRGGFVGYAASAGAPQAVVGSAGGVVVPTALETPWGNVVEVRRRVEPKRGGAIALLVLNSVFWGGFGGAYLATAPSFGAGSGGETAFRAVGWGSVGVGALIDLFLLPDALATSVDEVVYPAR